MMNTTANIKIFLLVLIVFLLTACGGGGGSSDAPSTSSGGGSPPAPVSVELGANFSIFNDQTLALASTVTGGGTLAYQWHLVSGPPVTFTTQNAANTIVTYTASSTVQTYVFRLTVSNEVSNASDTVTVTVNSRGNTGEGGATPAPVTIELGNDLTIFNDQPLQLRSSVGGGGSISYQWQLLSGPAVSFSTPNTANTDVIYTANLQTETYVFRLTAANEVSSASDTLAVTIKDRIHEAVKTGNPALLPDDAMELEQRIRDVVAVEQQALQTFHDEIFADNAVVYDPTRNSRFFTADSLNGTKEVVMGNKGKILVAGFEDDGRRAVAFASNILVELNSGKHVTFADPLRRLINWLLAPQQLSAADGDAFTVALMLMTNSSMSSTESWLVAQYPNANIVRCTAEAALATCLRGADVIITGSSTTMSQSAVVTALEQAVNERKSLIYTHDGSWNSTALTNPVLSYFGVQTAALGDAGNYFVQDAANWSSSIEMRDNGGMLMSIYDLVTRFQLDAFSFNIANCGGDETCSAVPAYVSEFLDVSQKLRNITKDFDEQARDVFAEQDKLLIEKLLILLADKYRKSVSFPMSLSSTKTLAFLKSYFADHLVYVSRRYNPTQRDLGNFSRADFSHVTPVTKTVDLVSRKAFRAAGVYALPGQTIVITRKDTNTAVAAKVFINTQRSSSTQHMVSNNGYNRPKFLQSHHVPIAAGESVTITSPYGGPVQVEFFDEGTMMRFEFSNVGLHPYWAPGLNDTAFLAALAAGDYDWAELVTEHFEVHSSLLKMRNTFNDSRWDTPTEIEYFITKYHHNYHKVLSGYQGESIDVVNEVHYFATANGFAVPEYSFVQHFNADQQACGAGCSGNPYDANWAFGVLAHGDLHEVGHNFESGRFKFNGFEGHATTNFYSYYVKSRALDEDGVAHQCQSLPFDSMLNDVQTSRTMADPKAYMASRGYSAWNQGAALIIEMLMHAENRGALVNGWHLIPRMHILQKAFEGADDNDSDWEAAKSRLGFSSYTRSEARSLDNNDWLLIAVSYSAGLDYRPFLDLFGLPYSNKASAQVASFGFSPVESAFFTPTTNNSYCDTLVQPKVSF